jgi:secreted trypsin-like serine protease
MRLVRLVTLALACACAAPVAQAIVIRHDIPDAAYLARESEFPALFALYRTRAGHRDCIATVISERFAITAAHCTENARLTAAASPGGAGYAVDISGVPNRVLEVVRHPARANGAAPDFALLRLADPVRHVAPIPLHRDSQETGRIVLIPGWGGFGNGETGLGAPDGRFRVAENRIDSAEDGRLLWTFDAPSTGKALTLEGISGPGDSGGPALIRTPSGLEIAGVSSAQRTGDGPEGVYGVTEVFVRVSDYAAWISDRTGEP